MIGKVGGCIGTAGEPIQPGLGLRRALGFTVVELVVTMAIILTICAIAIPNLMAAMDYVKIARSMGDLRTIGDGVVGYSLVNSRFPDTLGDVGYGELNDPWGTPYQYLNFAGVQGKGKMRKDRFLVPINTYFDLYSTGKDGKSVPPLTAQPSRDDVVWANDGTYLGLASEY